MTVQLHAVWKKFEMKIMEFFTEAYKLPEDIQVLASECVEVNLINWKQALFELPPNESILAEQPEQPSIGPVEIKHEVEIAEVVITYQTDIGSSETVCEQPGSEQPGTEQPGTQQPDSEQPGTEQPGTEHQDNTVDSHREVSPAAECDSEGEEYVACEILPLLELLKDGDTEIHPAPENVNRQHPVIDVKSEQPQSPTKVCTRRRTPTKTPPVQRASRKRKKVGENLTEEGPVKKKITVKKETSVDNGGEKDIFSTPKRKVGRPRSTFFGEVRESGKEDYQSCTMCNKKLYSEKGYKQHMKHHQTGATWKCQYCAKSFYTKVAFDNHESSHTNPMKCPECDYVSGSQYWIDRHIEKVHRATKSFLCSLCAKGFKYHSALKEHLQVHHYKLGNHQCNQCEYKGASKTLLTQHLKNMHTPYERIQCDICQASLKSRATLEKHRRKHFATDEYPCTVCNTKLRGADILEQHMKHVHGKRNHRCEVCTKCFPSKAKLRVHSVIHTDEKAFSCDLCMYKCNVKHNLDKHYKMVHKQKLSKKKYIVPRITATP